MKYRIETFPGDDCWDYVKKIEFGSGLWYYIYIDDEPALAVENGDPIDFSEAVIFNDYLALGNYDHGIHLISLIDFKVINVEVKGYFDSFAVDRNILYVLGCEDIMAFGGNLDLLWKTEHLSTDGVVFKSIEDNTMTVSCCYHPMEEWFDRKISLLDGKIIA